MKMVSEVIRLELVWKIRQKGNLFQRWSKSSHSNERYNFFFSFK